ncbi:MAG: serine protease AprX [Algoriphagus sp.]|jgi:serine protease AprX
MKKILLILLLLQTSLSFAQQKYLILFTDKADSPFSVSSPQDFLSARSIERREKQGISITEHDLPVNPSYVANLISNGFKVLYTSKWFNGALIDISSSELENVLALPFVKGVEGMSSNGLEDASGGNFSAVKEVPNMPMIDAGTSANQLQMLGADKMHEMKFTGKGILIGLMDSGFSNADKLDVFNAIFNENRILQTFNFVNGTSEVYASSHNHGTNVLSCIGARLDGQMVGTAPDASFALYVTENVSSETRLEEANWLFAAEKADSLGVDIVGSSLGYSVFQGSVQDYSYANMDGNTAIVTKAADWLVSKGVLVVVSGGNEGNGTWKYITAPADGDSVIAVAAVNSNGNYVSFSSLGPSVDGRVKPEVAAKGAGTTIARANNTISSANGTSFAAPLITGLVAGIKQAFPDFTAMEIRELLLESGSQANQPDSLLGYGIPNFERVYDLAQLKTLISITDQDVLIFPNPLGNNGNIKVLITRDELGNQFDVSLTDVTGRLLFENSFKRSFFEINLTQQELPTGLYLLKVWNGLFTHTERLLIE